MSIHFRAASRRATPPSSIASYVGRAIVLAPLLAATGACSSVLGIDEPDLRPDEETRGEEGDAGASCSSSTATSACGESVNDDAQGAASSQGKPPPQGHAERGAAGTEQPDETSGEGEGSDTSGDAGSAQGGGQNGAGGSGGKNGAGGSGGSSGKSGSGGKGGTGGTNGSGGTGGSPGTSGAGGSGGAGGTGGVGCTTADAFEPNDTAAKAAPLTDVYDCRDVISTPLTMDGSDDWFSFKGGRGPLGGVFCDGINARAWVLSSQPLRVCYYLKPAASVACPAGTEFGHDQVPNNYAGCCASNLTTAVFDERDAQVLIKISPEPGVDACFTYNLSYQY
jgi:hypothetical protein